MYEFLTGPLLWVSFSLFFFGLIGRVVFYIRGLDWKLDRVAYSKNLSYGIKGAVRSVGYWLVPFATKGWQSRPVFTLMFFLFHGCLMVTPIFLLAHQMLLPEKWQKMLPSLSDTTADVFTLIVIGVAVILVFRRIGLPEVRILTKPHDALALLIAVMPFLTGFFAHHQVYSYPFWLYAHIISGHILLIALPFTKLSHFVLFFLSRIQIGMDFGIKRGGMKGRGMGW